MPEEQIHRNMSDVHKHYAWKDSLSYRQHHTELENILCTNYMLCVMGRYDLNNWLIESILDGKKLCAYAPA